MSDNQIWSIGTKPRSRWNPKEGTETGSPTVKQLTTIFDFILVPGPYRCLVSIEIVRRTRDCGLKTGERLEVSSNHDDFTVCEIVEPVLQQTIDLKKAPRRKARRGTTIGRIAAISSCIDPFVVCQR